MGTFSNYNIPLVPKKILKNYQLREFYPLADDTEAIIQINKCNRDLIYIFQF